MEISFEKEVCSYLRLPSIPKKEHDGVSPFDTGVAVIVTRSGIEEYAVATFNPDKHNKPQIKKVFGVEPFVDVKSIFVVPEYMDKDVTNADLDVASKKKAEEIIKEAEEIENEGIELENDQDTNTNPYYFDFIHNDEQALAYIEAFNKKNKINGKLPQKHETILMRLAVIHSEIEKKTNKR